jgi:beta-galactosidase GanA
MSYWQTESKCKMCGQPFQHWRNSRAETCSSACRKAWSRRRHTLKKTYAAIMISLGTYRNMLKRYPDLQPEILEQLNLLSSEIHFVRLLGKDPEEQARFAMLNDVAQKRDRV